MNAHRGIYPFECQPCNKVVLAEKKPLSEVNPKWPRSKFVSVDRWSKEDHKIWACYTANEANLKRPYLLSKLYLFLKDAQALIRPLELKIYLPFL